MKSEKVSQEVSQDVPQECKGFDANNWIYVGDIEDCQHSKQQVGIVKKLGLELKGAILCNDPDHADSDACKNVPAFPSFCNLESKICVSGLRHYCAQFEDLQRLSDEEMNKTKTGT